MTTVMLHTIRTVMTRAMKAFSEMRSWNEAMTIVKKLKDTNMPSTTETGEFAEPFPGGLDSHFQRARAIPTPTFRSELMRQSDSSAYNKTKSSMRLGQVWGQ